MRSLVSGQIESETSIHVGLNAWIIIYLVGLAIPFIVEYRAKITGRTSLPVMVPEKKQSYTQAITIHNFSYTNFHEESVRDIQTTSLALELTLFMMCNETHDAASSHN